MVLEINNVWIQSFGLILMLSSFIWSLSKKRYDIAIGLFFVAVAYSVIVFLIK